MNLTTMGQVTANLSEGGKFLDYGVRNVVFKGITKGSVGNDTKYTTLAVNLDVEEYGEYIFNIFEPNSNERTPNGFGGENPSQTEQFFVILNCILAVTNPEVAKNPSVICGPTFTDIIKQMAEATSGFIGKTTQAKFLPGKNNFAGLPTYPASIGQTGKMTYNKFFGDDLTLSARDIKQIDKAKAARANARPTDMSKSAVNANNENVLANMALDDNDDLPF